MVWSRVPIVCSLSVAAAGYAEVIEQGCDGAEGSYEICACSPIEGSAGFGELLTFERTRRLEPCNGAG